ncbi:HPF/RaiA family ribosome-associated protein [Pseudoalteromonas sp. OFAV1]|uniref:HPF/RaiA family ribosome-associated protein n=1 Tax=Pseudoalteromonas sp. OFAV1 TaxID=2908892 RepID=UPI001F35BA8E|nr:HPF/RaiA family ribosome-associated protein [Pseudoalteromonas sp. OFAV1]MCF2902997.1 HPF/RaiA family ribosome-associated protein [Pseudoalteromonas sp. OFAV1]
MIKITCHGFEQTSSIKENVEDKFQKLNERFPLLNAKLTISITNKIFTCQLSVHSADLGDVQASQKSEDFHYCLNNTFRKAKEILNENKNKFSRKGNTATKELSIDIQESDNDKIPVEDIAA